MTWTPERVERLKEPAWSAEDEARLRELWDKGASAAEISVALGYRHTRNAVIGKVRRLKLPFRRAGQTSRTGKPRIGHFTAEDDALMMRLFAEGRTHQEIAIATGRGRGTVGSRLGFLGCRRLKAKRPTVMKAPPKIKVVSAPAIHTAEELSIRSRQLNIPLMDLEPHHCRWPTSDVPFLFCGLTKAGPLSYCEYHARLAYRPAETREQRKAAA